MKKIIICLSGIVALNTHAGNMGPVSTSHTTTPYLGVDGSYTWQAIDGYTVNKEPPSLSTNGWGGRLSVGIDRSYTEKLSLNAEVGGGYYGSANLNNPLSGIISSLKISGYDVLAGATYHTPYIDIFGDFGFMAQTLMGLKTNYVKLRVPGNVMDGTVRISTTQTAILPELKVGGAYQYSDNLSIALSYTYVFGDNMSGVMNNAAEDIQQTRMFVKTDCISRNPSLSTILLGLRYHFI